jgi:hypothetical protein
MTTALQAYAFGNCTYYIAERYPGIFPWLGNAKDWITNAKKQGYPILMKPHPDTIVVYGSGNGYSSLGHVAVVDSLNPDGSFNVSEMNYNGFDLIDQRRSTMRGVIGFIVPPGSSFNPANAQLEAAFGAATSSGPCVFPGPNIFGTQICMDGVVGVLAMAAGGALIVAGIIVFVAFALKNSGVANKAADALPFVGGPAGAVAAVAVKSSTPKPKPSEQQPSPQEAKAASEERMTRARARVKEPPAIEGYNAQRQREEKAKRSEAA